MLAMRAISRQTDSRPDSMFDCARGLRSNYARFSRVRSAKELTFSTFTIPFVICFRSAFKDHYKFPPIQRYLFSPSSIDRSTNIFFSTNLFKVREGKKLFHSWNIVERVLPVTNPPPVSKDVRGNIEVINYLVFVAVTRPLSRYHILISWNISRVSRWTFSLRVVSVHIKANSMGKSELEEDHAREREDLFLI